MSPDGSTKPPPPEEKLLKLIRDKSPQPAVVVSSAVSLSKGTVFKGKTAAGGRVVRRWPKTRWVSVATGGLSVVLVLETIFCIIQLIRPVPPIRLPDLTAIKGAGPMDPTEVLPVIPSIAASAAHPLFATLAVNPNIPAPPGGGSPSGAAKLLAARLTLMGIMAGNPGQAIIEDSQTKKSYFVTIGQAVVEGAVVEKILDNRVLLDLAGEKIELSL